MVGDLVLSRASYRCCMRQGDELDLGTALRINGTVPVTSDYDDVAVRLAPGWLTVLWGKGVAAMALPRTVYVSPDTMSRLTAGNARTLLLHEAVHVDQWRRYGRTRFLVRYLGDYLKGRAVGLPHRVAYRAIRFEREAVEQSEQ